jgi:hypothetical protein
MENKLSWNDLQTIITGMLLLLLAAGFVCHLPSISGCVSKWRRAVNDWLDAV